MNLEKIIENFILNFKKYLYAIIGLISGVLLIEYGILKAIFILVLGFVGYKIGDTGFQNKIKKQILNRLKD
ncbi:DUF2273 domain-containing protein [uncultured Cetobacterium sp.]|uniref:DUF2273 domain-containing protein n=1 Tax=uncultured Cetobacterium sp. TaxID=527638 RepID=UPI0026069997|nr:DUF2273 domain-containing protein [uncultured Cetobacterium sp.]